MEHKISDILSKRDFSKDDIVYLLKTEGKERLFLFDTSNKIKTIFLGRNTYYRGLIEFSNFCSKDCYYCGIRKSNKNVKRYRLYNDEILKAAEFAYKENYASIVLQSGELFNNQHIRRITELIKDIKLLSNNTLGITISLGEQSYKTYKQWFDAGAHRYLLRIETSDRNLYSRLHPLNQLHDFDTRILALKNIRKVGFQVGSGVMIGLPFQGYDQLANDLLFLKELDIDMCGMGPFIPHTDTPLYRYKNQLWPLNVRFDLSLKMIAILRIMMKDINIAATTALQSIDKIGREKAIKVGANIIMPNITPGMYRDNYRLYNNKPCTDEEAEDCKSCLEARISMAGDEIGYSKWGDSPHFIKRTMQR